MRSTYERIFILGSIFFVSVAFSGCGGEKKHAPMMGAFPVNVVAEQVKELSPQFSSGGRSLPTMT